jgi:hypothetical protein
VGVAEQGRLGDVCYDSFQTIDFTSRSAGRLRKRKFTYVSASGDRQGVKPRKSNRKGIANQTGSESCVAHREVRDEALRGGACRPAIAAKAINYFRVPTLLE